MKLQDFFATHPVFTSEELSDFLAENYSDKVKTQQALINHYLKTGRVLRIRRGLYAVVPPGSEPESVLPDPYLIAAKVVPDSVLGYHTALQLHAKSYSIENVYHYLTSTDTKRFHYQGQLFVSHTFPSKLMESGQVSFGVETAVRSGMEIRVTTLERTLVDLMDRPSLGGGWEEIWRSLEMVEYFDLDQMVEYTLLLGNSTTAAKVGFYLDQHRNALFVSDEYLAQLSTIKPQRPHYMVRGMRENARFVPQWNLMVPLEILERNWEAVL